MKRKKKTHYETAESYIITKWGSFLSDYQFAFWFLAADLLFVAQRWEKKLQAALAFALKLAKQLKRFCCTLFLWSSWCVCVWFYYYFYFYFYFLVKLVMPHAFYYISFSSSSSPISFFNRVRSFHEWKVANVIWLQQIIMQCLIPAFKICALWNCQIIFYKISSSP